MADVLGLVEPTLVTSSDLPAAIAEIESAEIVAVDTEFHAERRYYPVLYLVQVHVPGGGTWIFDPLTKGVLEAVAPALRATNWLVHGGHNDMVVLLRALGGLPDKILDIQIASGLAMHWFPNRYGVLAEHWTGTSVEKGETLSDWSRRPLSVAQLAYAADDVILLPQIWSAIEEALTENGRLSAALAACDEARAAVVDPPSVDENWRSVRGVEVLRPQQAAVLQELVAWREEVARSLNSPTRGIVSDGVLLWLARNQPLSTSALPARKVPKAVVKKHGEELIARIIRAGGRPEWGWPVVVSRGTIEAARLTWLRAFAQANAQNATWGHQLVTPEDVLYDLVAVNPQTRTALKSVLGDWRDSLIGDAIWQAVQGAAPLPWPSGSSS